MQHLWQRMVENLFGRLDGPLHFRFIVQPLMAAFFAVIDGMKDAKAGKPAYFWAITVESGRRKELIRDGWKHMGKIVILAVVLDIAYQLIVHHTVYPGEMLIVTFLLAILPYVALRGPVNRIMRFCEKYKTGGKHG